MEIIIDPQLPYASSVSKFCKPGNRLKISGAKSSGTQGFTVYLQCTDTIPGDIALQVKVNLADSTVSLSSQLRSLWNVVHNIHTPQLQCAEKFELTILCDSTEYKIFMNERNICEYPQRISYKRVTDLLVEGDATLERIAYEVAPVAVSYPANRLLTHRIGFTHTDKPPPYSDVQSQSYPQNVNYGAHSIPSAPYPTETTWPLPMPSQSFSVQETHARTTGTAAPATAAASSNLRPVERSKLKEYIKYAGLIFLFLVVLIASAFKDKKYQITIYSRNRVAAKRDKNPGAVLDCSRVLP